MNLQSLNLATCYLQSLLMVFLFDVKSYHVRSVIPMHQISLLNENIFHSNQWNFFSSWPIVRKHLNDFYQNELSYVARKMTFSPLLIRSCEKIFDTCWTLECNYQEICKLNSLPRCFTPIGILWMDLYNRSWRCNASLKHPILNLIKVIKDLTLVNWWHKGSILNELWNSGYLICQTSYSGKPATWNDEMCMTLWGIWLCHLDQPIRRPAWS